MKETIVRVAVLGLLVGFSSMVYAQQHDHSQHTSPAKAPAQQHDHLEHARGKVSAADDDDTAIFCPTMKTGQLCSHGTANVLQLKGQKQQAWIEAARKYNQSVDAATVQLFKDAEGSLTPEQAKQLKAWFAVGLNPQINDLLYSKGLGPKQP